MLTRRNISAWFIVALVFPVFSSVPMHAQKALPAPVELSSGWQLQDAAKVSDAGAAISSDTYPTKGWLAATVPGTVLTSMVNDGIYPEPLYGENSRPIPESLNKTSYWYRTTFSVPKKYAHRQVALHFDGANFRSEVWVNGTHVGTIQGAFIRGQFDITKLVKAGETATLAVQVFPQPHPGVPHQHTIANGVGLKRRHYGNRRPHIFVHHWMGLAALRRRPRYRPVAEGMALRIWTGADRESIHHDRSAPAAHRHRRRDREDDRRKYLREAAEGPARRQLRRCEVFPKNHAAAAQFASRHVRPQKQPQRCT